MSEQVTELQLLLAEFAALPPLVERQTVLDLLRSFSGQRVYFSHRQLVTIAERQARIRMAATLLAARMSRADAARVIMVRCGVKKASAYKIVNAALMVQPKEPEVVNG